MQNVLRATLLRALSEIDGLNNAPSPVAGGIALTHLGKEFAHFHHDNEIDLRLTAKVIAAEGLTHPTGSIQHPKRSTKSPWIEVRFSCADDITHVVRLVKLAIDALRA